MTLTPAQLHLLELLMLQAISNPADLARRWENAAPFVRQHAENGLLLLARDWGFDTVISATGEVLVIDHEASESPRPATQNEIRLALFRSIRHYPELLSFIPPRPSAAQDCPGCSGTGVLPIVLTNPDLRYVVCQCGGAGWFPDTGPRIINAGAA